LKAPARLSNFILHSPQKLKELLKANTINNNPAFTLFTQPDQ
jgi:hypothetical protein